MYSVHSSCVIASPGVESVAKYSLDERSNSHALSKFEFYELGDQ